jgi:hypothetical protein
MPNGTPDLTNAPTPFYAPGEIGNAFNDQNTGRGYLRVRLDSGATSATGVGAVQAGQLAFWKDRTNNLVTNDQAQCDSIATANGWLNRVAGIFQTAVKTAPGTNDSNGQPITYVCDIVIAGKNVNVWTKASGATIGCQAVADTTASTAQILALGATNTAPTSQVIGTFRSSTITSNLAPVDVGIGFVGV